MVVSRASGAYHVGRPRPPVRLAATGIIPAGVKVEINDVERK